MSADQTRREINQLNNEIASLEKKRSNLEQKEADRARKINDVQKSITRNTSASMLSSKSRRIQGYQGEIAKYSKDKADVTKKLADKRKKHAEKTAKLQREEATDKKKEANAQRTIQQGYERRISELSIQLNHQTADDLQQHIPAGNGEDMEEYDVFISHAWEDKEAFVVEFVAELSAFKIKAWYDKQQIAWGDSMRAKIDKGLAKSKFGIAVISPYYIADGKYWTKAELDGLFQLESVNGKMLLPIWHNITKKEVMEYSPIVAGRLAMTTASMTPKEIADELVKLLKNADMNALA